MISAGVWTRRWRNGLALTRRSIKNICTTSTRAISPAAWAKGELYNYDPATGDARSCGTTASLCGVEQALEKDDKTALDYAVKRDLLLHTAMAFLQGLPHAELRR